MNLPLYKHRIELPSAVVNRDHALEFHIAGFFIDFDYADMRAKGKCACLWFPENCRLQACFNAGLERVRGIGCLSYPNKGDRFLGRTDYGEFAVF